MRQSGWPPVEPDHTAMVEYDPAGLVVGDYRRQFADNLLGELTFLVLGVEENWRAYSEIQVIGRPVVQTTNTVITDELVGNYDIIHTQKLERRLMFTLRDKTLGRGVVVAESPLLAYLRVRCIYDNKVIEVAWSPDASASFVENLRAQATDWNIRNQETDGGIRLLGPIAYPQ